MEGTHEASHNMRTESKTLKEETFFQETLIKYLTSNLSKLWTKFEKANRKLNSILEEQQTVRRELRNLQQQKDDVRKKIYYLHEKEDNPSPPTLGDEPITHTSQKIR
ncbi:hypothetical protein O181_052021 [Austropuccinia psidii MF-1]|uniref:Uncharacterized protein n=1 Tax=Austropuccinia psidii MF-1 TaxID=1389203 RepID=A0A9Q3HNW3_9BASI|nr:hypothetical protein [Austropuccinia psidii MF-1]